MGEQGEDEGAAPRARQVVIDVASCGEDDDAAATAATQLQVAVTEAASLLPDGWRRYLQGERGGDLGRQGRAPGAGRARATAEATRRCTAPRRAGREHQDIDGGPPRRPRPGWRGLS